MSILLPTVSGDSVQLDIAQCRSAGASLNEQYTTSSPFPSIVLEDFLPAAILQRVVDEFPKRAKGRFSDAYSQNKTGYQLEMIDSIFVTNLLQTLNSSAMINFVESLTGIEGLIPDPHLVGGGLHETGRGGFLRIHADFNINNRLALKRRVNLILFLNEEWKEEYLGYLELWDRDMVSCKQRVAPKLGTAVLFNTDSDAFHGHPDPLNTPADVYRRSIAMYYYSAVPAQQSDDAPHTTLFQVRPGSQDSLQKPSALKTVMRDICPPFLSRMLMRKRPNSN